MAGRIVCGQCGVQRAKPGELVCPVCWLLNDLRDEHTAGDHTDDPNGSCIACRAAQGERLASVITATRPRRVVQRETSETTPSKIKTDVTEATPRTGATAVTDRRSGPISHTTCTHERTPRARAICRRERARHE